MDLSIVKNAITAMLDDRADIFSLNNFKNSDGTTASRVDETPRYTDIKCRLSYAYRNGGEAYPEEPHRNAEKIKAKIFFEADAPITRGDYVSVKRYDSNNDVLIEYFGIIGSPACYRTHKEVIFEQRSGT